MIATDIKLTMWVSKRKQFGDDGILRVYVTSLHIVELIIDGNDLEKVTCLTWTNILVQVN